MFLSSAVGLSANTFYKNAPIYVAGGATVNDGTISLDSVKPLFSKSGINNTVLQNLLNMIDSDDVWVDETGESIASGENQNTYLSAKNFGHYNDSKNFNENQNGNSRLLVKLFEDIEDVSNTNNINDFTNQFFQVVFRSLNQNSDVLTLYMCKSFITAQFNPMDETVVDGYTYKREGNYSLSYLRNKTVLPIYDTLCATFTNINLDKYVVAPYQLSSYGADDLSNTNLTTEQNQINKFYNLGAWQSSLVQTSANANGVLVGNNIDSSLGASSYGDSTLNPTAFSLGNGLDGKNVATISTGTWASTMLSAYTDKLWIPSSFEVMHTGFAYDGKENILNIDKPFDNDICSSYLDNAESIDASFNTTIGNTRTGLWELNAFDRAEDGQTWSWVRSGRSTKFNGAKDIEPNGVNNGNSAEHTDGGVRIALHLDLSLLKNECNLTTLKTGTNEQDNFTAKFIFDNNKNNTYNMVANSQNDYVYFVNNFSIGSSGGIQSITDRSTNKQTPINFVNNISSKEVNGIADIEIVSKTANEQVYKISNVNKGEYEFNVSYSVLPSYSCALTLPNNIDKDALLIISSSENQVFMFKLSATDSTVNFNIPKLIVGRTYTITVINGEISGILTAEGEAVVTSSPYTFVCNTENATINLSGITIS